MKIITSMVLGVLLTTNMLMAQKKPNVLFVVFDDLRPQIGAYGLPDPITPNIDKIANEGTRFNSAYVTYPLCLPSRSAMLTGIRFDNQNFTGDKSNKNILYNTMIKTQTVWPKALHDAGYWTVIRGKIYHGAVPKYQENIWDIAGPFWPNGFHDWSPELVSKIVDKGGVPKDLQGYIDGTEGPGALMYASIDCKDNELHDGMAADAVVDYLLKDRDKSKPFAICAGFSRPHLPWVAPRKYFDMYAADAGKLAPVPQGVERIIRKQDYRPLSTNTWNEGVNDSVAKRLVRAYMAVTSYSDAQLGRIITALKETGEYDNTIIIVWGDHGYHLSEHGMWQKNTNYKVNMRCPLIIKAPGYKAGQVCEHVVQNTDIYPTVLSLCQVTKPNDVVLHGHDLAPLLKNPKAPWEDLAYISSNKHHGVITDQFRFTDFGKGDYELYDIKNDPDEWVNLANDPKYKGVVEELKEKVDGTVWNKKQ